jgi:hypothetical protein
MLLVSTYTVQIAHSGPRPLDRQATEYLTCAIIPDPLHQVSYSCHDTHRYPPCCTCQLHTMRQANKLSRIQIQTSSSQWLITIKWRNWQLGFSHPTMMDLWTHKKRSYLERWNTRENSGDISRGETCTTSFEMLWTYSTEALRGNGS